MLNYFDQDVCQWYCPEIAQFNKDQFLWEGTHGSAYRVNLHSYMQLDSFDLCVTDNNRITISNNHFFYTGIQDIAYGIWANFYSSYVMENGKPKFTISIIEKMR